MPTPTLCLVSGALYGPDAAPVSGAVIKCYVSTGFTDLSGNFIPAGVLASTTSDESGLWSLSVIRTETLARSVTFQFEYPLGNNQSASKKYAAVIPDAATADFADLVDLSTGSSILAAAATTDALPEGTTNLYFTVARALAAISATAPILDTAGVISIPKADASTDGYLSAADFATFSAAAAPPVTSVNGLIGDVVLTTDEIAEGGTNEYYTDAKADNRITIQKGAANGLADLDGSGKIKSSQLPALAITDTFVVASQAAMLALSAETGDVAVRTDQNKTYILQGSDPSVLADWQELLSPTSDVTSVNGQTGAVTLSKSDVGLGNVDNTSDATKNSATATLTNKTLTAPVINSPTGLMKGDVGLGNVDNTSDATKNAAAATLTNKVIAAGSNSISGLANSNLSGSAAISNANLAAMATATIKGNSTGGSATPSDLSATTVTSMLNAFVGDSGSGGTKGLVPAPSTGDAAAGKFLKADGTFAVPSGGSGFTTSQVFMTGYTGAGSTNTKVIIFANAAVNTGSDISYSTSGSLGDSFTINTTGLYECAIQAYSSANQYIGVCVNPSSKTTAISSINYANGNRMMAFISAGLSDGMARTLLLTAGDVVYPMFDAASGLDPGTGYTSFSITRVK